MKRVYHDLIANHLEHLRQMVFLMGPRQVGKTTLSISFLEKSENGHYFNWDRLDHRLLFLDGPQALAKQSGLLELKSNKPILIFDEIHKFKRWKLLLKGFFDSYEKQAKIIVTGSAKLDTYKKGGDSLMGRYFYYRIHPLSVAEITSPSVIDTEIRKNPQKINQDDWEALITHGGFPEPYTQRSLEFSRRWQKTRQDQLLKEDIRDETKIQEVGLIEILAKILQAQAAQSMDYTSLSKKVGVTVDTIKRWLEVLKSFYYCFALQPWSKNIKRSLIKEPKLYLWDWSLIDNQGQRLENFIASHLLKAVHFWNDRGMGDYGLYYLRTKEKEEVDFIVIKNQKPWFIVEVKASDVNISPSLYVFQKQLECPYAFQVVVNLPYVENDCFATEGIKVVPAKTFLSQLL